MSRRNEISSAETSSVTLQRCMQSAVGPLFLVASETGLRGILWHDPRLPPVTDPLSPQARILDATEQQLTEYLGGERTTFDLPLEPEGTAFQHRVWGQLRQIPYGETCSYQDIASALEDRNASRAVGTANGRNPLSIVVPCHRVIASNGTLAGYAGGLPIKERLLRLEQTGTLPA